MEYRIVFLLCKVCTCENVSSLFLFYEVVYMFRVLAHFPYYGTSAKAPTHKNIAIAPF